MLQRLTVRAPAQVCLVDITGEVQNLVRAAGVAEGTVLLYVPHTTCAITIQENADPGVQHDMRILVHGKFSTLLRQAFAWFLPPAGGGRERGKWT
jgi:secondary thiamine-phosphate synthase enzyme